MTQYSRDTLIKDVNFGPYFDERIQHACRRKNPPLVTLGDLMDAGKNYVMWEEGVGKKAGEAIDRVLASVSEDPDGAGEYKELYF